ncbi:hypothetical protein P3342_010551 [Pyrenophora teres f. teres]|uniref:Uncharacterized protein n=1 Tax=Pyrenophora teres f. teres TaxID=97479 RepID=A0A6S6WB77_9PLEO|nr:hypothetical protein PTNB29_06949 [Pyrenophora teres f. teres]KAE8865097.1 hypothetical protein PTNB73_05985 [Pyrenophora teres f. teres]KAK1914562.1 hypothetical protein P3342_010551 [Pyrenophora teres f. teres]CAE7200961.1 hypothetical protein PTTW11_08758 [Pyrenophora teres f. teres]
MDIPPILSSGTVAVVNSTIALDAANNNSGKLSTRFSARKKSIFITFTGPRNTHLNINLEQLYDGGLQNIERNGLGEMTDPRISYSNDTEMYIRGFSFSHLIDYIRRVKEKTKLLPLWWNSEK